MILQFGAAVVEQLFIKGGYFIIEQSISWSWWGVSKIYYSLASNENQNNEYILIELKNNKLEIEALRNELELVKRHNKLLLCN